MPESEVPYEFLVDAPDRRKQDRRQSQSCHEPPCVNLIMTENRMAQLADEFHGYKAACNRELKKASVEREEIINKLDKIDSHLDRQKGFFAGVVWLGTGIVAVVGTVIAYIKG